MRRYARDIGVKSPCTYRKKDLIKKIKDVESGKILPYFSKKGRPLCEHHNIDNIKAKQTPNFEKSDKNVLLYAIKRFKEFLEDLENEIKDKE